MAKAHGLFAEDVTKMQQDAEEKIKQEKEEFVKREVDYYLEECKKWLAGKKEEKRKRTEAVLQDLPELLEWRIRELDGRGARYFLENNTPRSMLRVYVLLLEYPEVEEVLKPYYTARLAPPWRDKFPKFSEAMPYISNSLERYRRENAKAQAFTRKQESWIKGWFLEPAHDSHYSETRYKLSLLNA
ncbi:MAG: hypothetical protein M3255_08880, partial [Pseudomonadota bacterium]|nr:hypothetical protein [Pseudomonadota bacterium]